MLRAEGLSKAYIGETIFEDVSFQLTKGERCALIGRNGCGKSTLLRLLIGEETPDAGTVVAPKNYRLGYLQQHIAFTQPTLRMEGALALPLDEREIPYRIEAILSGLGFSEEDFDKPPSLFSGGYQLRLHLAKTLVQEPDCLLLDEPTNYLDIVSVRWLVRFLASWRGEMLIISHDRTFLDAIATHTMGIHRKQLIRVTGKTPVFFDHVVTVEETHERTRVRVEKQKEHAEAFIKRFGAKATKAAQARSRKKAIARLPSLERLAQIEGLDFSFHSAPFPGRRMLQTEDVAFKYPGMDKLLIQDWNVEIEPGDRIGIIGKNGRGKSTLLRLLAGDLQPLQGTIKRSENVKIGFFGQTNVAKLNLELTVEQEIARTNIDLSFGEVRRICGVMMFSGKQAEKKIGVLSGGERSRVLLGKILAASCNLLLLDEPSNHLDIESIEALMESLEEFPGSVVIVSHDEEILRRIADKLIVCREREQIPFMGGYDYFLEKVGWEKSQKVKEEEPRRPSKADRRERAEQVQERSKRLLPIRRKIEALEREIASEEKSLNALQEEIAEIASSQDHKRIAELSRQIGELQKYVELRYVELEHLYQQLEDVS